MKLLIINGPNLNLLGSRQPTIYGDRGFGEYLETLRERYPSDVLDHYQSNVEGDIINALHRADGNYDGVLLNAGGYTHTSVSIADAVAAIAVPVVEVHLSCIVARESYRHTSLLAPHCKGSIMGFGMESYRLAVESFN